MTVIGKQVPEEMTHRFKAQANWIDWDAWCKCDEWGGTFDLMVNARAAFNQHLIAEGEEPRRW